MQWLHLNSVVIRYFCFTSPVARLFQSGFKSPPPAVKRPSVTPTNVFGEYYNFSMGLGSAIVSPMGLGSAIISPIGVQNRQSPSRIRSCVHFEFINRRSGGNAFGYFYATVPGFGCSGLQWNPPRQPWFCCTKISWHRS